MNYCKEGQCGIADPKGKDPSAKSCSCMAGAREENFLCLAKQAHYELLKEKMKAAFQAKIGAKMDKVASLAVETLLLSLQHKMEEDQKREAYEAKLMEIYRS